MSQFGARRAWWVAGGAVVLVVGLVVIALVREPVQLDPSTPEGTVQAYLQAVADKDYERALSMIDPAAHPGCEAADLASVRPQDSFSATIGATTTAGDLTYVQVTITMGGSPGPFDPGVGGYTDQFILQKSGGNWLIQDDPWPYFGWRCQEP